MIDELPGYVSDLSAHESAVDTAIADGWEIKGYAATHVPGTSPDTLVIALLWKAGASASPAYEKAKAAALDKFMEIRDRMK